MTKRSQQGCRRKKAVPQTGPQGQSKQPVNGETLRTAVLWVWSDPSTLTGTFSEAHGWSLKMLGRAAVSSYQGLTGALMTTTVTLLPLLCERMRGLMERHGGD